MPQQQLDLQPYGSTPLDLQPYQSEQSWPEWFIDQGLRTIPAVGGAMLGSAIGPWGTAGGGAAGAALGSALGQWYEGKGVNPYAVATEGALGAIPFLGEAPGAGAGLKQIAKYAGSSALQGGVQGALGSVPRHIASTGQWELPSMGEAVSEGLGGAAFGGAMGLGHGVYAGLQPKPIEPSARSQILTTEFNKPLGPGGTIGNLEPYGPEISPYGTGEGQAKLPFVEKPHIDAATFAAMRRAQMPTDESGQGLLFGPPPPADGGGGGGEIPRPAPPEQQQLPLIVTIKAPEAGTLQLLRSQGYVPVQGMRSPDGYPQWVRGDVAPMYIEAQKAKTAERPLNAFEQAMRAKAAEVPNAVNEGDVVAGDTVEVPRAKVNDTFIQNIGEEGYRISGETPTHYIFTKGGQAPKVGISEMADPTGPKDWENAASRVGDQSVQPGETTGRVAPFATTLPPKSGFTAEDLRNGIPIDEPSSVDQWPTETTTTHHGDSLDAINLLRSEIANYENQLANPELKPDGTRRYSDRVYDLVKQHLEQAKADLAGAEQRLSEDQGIGTFLHPPNLDIVQMNDGRFGVRDENSQIIFRGNTRESAEAFIQMNRGESQPNRQAMDPRMQERVEAGGPREFDFTQSHPEQGQLFPMEVAPTGDINALRTQQVLTREPEQLSMEGQMKDAEIADYLKGEDARPPEANDINMPPEGRNFLSEATGIPPDEFISMKIGERETILRNMQGSYAEHGARVANKELLQNAIDATQTGGTIEVELDHHGGGGKSPSITVRDTGPGLPIDLIRNEFVTLTGSGKRDKTSTTGRKSIGEMGVGKATYLLGTDSFEVKTVTVEPDGTTWKYEFSGNPEDMITGQIKINKQKMPDGTPTGTEVRVFDADKKNIDAAEEYLKTFAQYSDNPVTVKMTGNRYQSSGMTQYNLNNTIPPRSGGPGQHVISGSGPGGDFSLSVPDTAKWQDDGQSVVVIITSRGMFQGAETVYPGGSGRIPDRVVMNVEPTVSAQNAKEYPLTSPTRERMKGPFREVVVKAIKDNIMTAAEQKRQADIQAAYNALVPQPNPRNPKQTLGFVTNDRGGRYTPQEVANFNAEPRIQAIAGEMKKMLDRLDGLFPTQQRSKTVKFGFDLADPGAGGVNIPNIGNSAENAILVNFFSSVQNAPNPKVAAERLAHAILHEFNHNIVGEEGAGFTWQLIDTDSTFGTGERAVVADAIHRLITDSSGNYAPEIQRLLQQHIAARGRPDTTIDFIARQKQGRFAQQPGQGGIPVSGENAGTRTTPTEEPSAWQKVKGATGWGQGATKGGKQDPNEFNFLREALAVPSNATTTMDLSAPGRQGLSMILTPQFWKAAGAMFKGLSPEGFKQIDRELYAKPIMQRKVDLETGKVGKSVAQEIGLKVFRPASEGGPRAELTASRWLEKIPVLGIPVRASNRAYITFLNHLSVNRTQFLMDKARNMAIEALDTGSARPGIFRQKYSSSEAQDLNPYKNLVLGKEIADFVNTATGHAPLRTHLLPFKQAEVSLESAANKLNYVLFSPGLIASRIRMLNPSTYVMASPFVRKQYMKAALSTAAAWYAFTTMIQKADPDAEVSNDITSADFGKVRIGDTRLDPGGGFLQFLTAYGRAYAGGSTSSSTGQFHKFGAGYQAQTQEDMMERFFVNKLNPVAKFAYDLASASQYNPFHVGDRTMQMFVPLLAQDLNELYKEDPSLVPWMGPAAALGMGTQIYSKGESVGKLIPPENDWLVQGGGGIRSLMPWNYGEQ